MGFLVPLISNIWPAREALTRNLRTSLDASRRDGSGESISVTQQKLQDIGLSAMDMLTSTYFVVFGLTSFYFLPMAVIKGDQGLLFLILNLIMMSLILGVVLLFSIVMHSMQRAVLSIILLCRPSDKNLRLIIEKRLDSG